MGKMGGNILVRLGSLMFLFMMLIFALAHQADSTHFIALHDKRIFFLGSQNMARYTLELAGWGTFLLAI